MGLNVIPRGVGKHVVRTYASGGRRGGTHTLDERESVAQNVLFLALEGLPEHGTKPVPDRQSVSQHH